MKPLSRPAKEVMDVPKPRHPFWNEDLILKFLSALAIFEFFQATSKLVKEVNNPFLTASWELFKITLKITALFAYLIWSSFRLGQARYGNVFDSHELARWMVYAGWRLVPLVWWIALAIEYFLLEQFGWSWSSPDQIGMTQLTLVLMVTSVAAMVYVPAHLGYMDSAEVEMRANRADPEDRAALWNATILAFALKNRWGTYLSTVVLETIYETGIYTPTFPVPKHLEDIRNRLEDDPMKQCEMIDQLRADSWHFWHYWDKLYHDNGQFSYKTLGISPPTALKTVVNDPWVN